MTITLLSAVTTGSTFTTIAVAGAFFTGLYAVRTGFLFTSSNRAITQVGVSCRRLCGRGHAIDRRCHGVSVGGFVARIFIWTTIAVRPALIASVCPRLTAFSRRALFDVVSAFVAATVTAGVALTTPATFGIAGGAVLPRLISLGILTWAIHGGL